MEAAGEISKIGQDMEVGKVLDRAATMGDLQNLTDRCQRDHLEYGVLAYDTEGNGRQMLFAKGNAGMLHEPAPLEAHRGQVQGGTFIHTHFVDPESAKAEVINPRIILPSWGVDHGDFQASMFARTVAGYMNIASDFGLTLNIGIEGMSHPDDFMRQMRDRLGAQDLSNEEDWQVRSGPAKGTAFANSEIYNLHEEGATDKPEIISRGEPTLLSHTTQYGGIRHFLFLSWDKVSELAAVYGNLDNLCFGDGVDKLVTHLGLDIAHGKNLSEVAAYEGHLPQSRKESGKMSKQQLEKDWKTE